MAQKLSKTGIASLGTIRPGHVSQSIDAFTGIEAYDISLSGSFNMTGSINGQPGVVNPLTASYATTASYAKSATSSSYALTSSYSQNGGNQDLQSVTDNGATTSNTISIINNLNNTNTSIYNNSVKVTDIINDKYAAIDKQGRLILKSGNEESQLKNSNVTNADIILEFPDKPTGNYTIATTDDLNSYTTTSSFNNFTSSYNTGSFTGSFTGSLNGTASWASNAITSSYITASNVYGPYGSNSVISSSYAVTSSHALNASVQTSGSTLYSVNPGTSGFSTDNSIFLGTGSGFNATNASNSNFLGQNTGRQATNASNSNFLGYLVGYNATNANASNFLGYTAGYNATNANNSNFLGQLSGYNALNANNSNFFGQSAGWFALSASNSTLIGFQVGRSGSWGTIGSNNIIIGTNISLPNARNNSINLGGVIFATGSYSTTSGDTYTGSQANARVGIAKDYPNSTLDVAGNTTVTGSLIVSGSTSFAGTYTLSGSNTITGITVLSGSIDVSGSSNFHNTIFIVTGSQFFTGSSHFIGNQDITGSLKITGSSEGSGFYIDGNKQFNYASYANTSSISGSANISHSFSYDSPDGSAGISLVSGSRITFSHSGVYNIQFSAQLYTQTGATVHIWFKETGSNIPESGTRVGPTSNGDYLAPAWNFVKYFPSGSYAELAWQSDQANTQFPYIATTGNIPSCPAIIVTVTQVR